MGVLFENENKHQSLGQTQIHALSFRHACCMSNHTPLHMFLERILHPTKTQSTVTSGNILAVLNSKTNSFEDNSLEDEGFARIGVFPASGSSGLTRSISRH